MTYEDLAAVFDDARAAGATVAQALERVDAARPANGPKLTPVQRAEVRTRRRDGALIRELREDFDLCDSYTRHLCEGVRKAKPAPAPLPEIAHQVVEATALYFHLTADEVVAIPTRGRPRGPVRTARRAAALVMVAHTPLSYMQITRALGRTDHTTALSLIDSAKADPAARRAADEIATSAGLDAGRAA